MAYSLQHHPFGVKAFFEQSLVLTFALPKAALQPLLPESLSLDTYQDAWAFMAVAFVQTKKLRPVGFPALLGNDFMLIGYRLFVRYTNAAGKRLRGLYILQSETNSRRMHLLGSIFTQYKYATIDIRQWQTAEGMGIFSPTTGLSLAVARPGAELPALPEKSPFSNWKEARRFAGPLPFTFSYQKNTGQMILVEGMRENWQPRPLQVISYEIPLLNTYRLADKAVLASAFMVNNIPYQWKKGKIEQWAR